MYPGCDREGHGRSADRQMLFAQAAFPPLMYPIHGIG